MFQFATVLRYGEVQQRINAELSQVSGQRFVAARIHGHDSGQLLARSQVNRTLDCKHRERFFIPDTGKRLCRYGLRPGLGTGADTPPRSFKDDGYAQGGWRVLQVRAGLCIQKESMTLDFLSIYQKVA